MSAIAPGLPSLQPTLSHLNPAMAGHPPGSCDDDSIFIFQQLRLIAGSAKSSLEVVSLVRQLVERQSTCVELWLCSNSGDHESAPMSWLPVKLPKAVQGRGDASSELQSIFQQNAPLNLSCHRISEDRQSLLVAANAGNVGLSREWLVGKFSLASHSSTRSIWLMELVAQAIAARHQNLALTALQQQLQLGKIWQNRLERLSTAADRGQLGMLLANHIKGITRSEQVAVALVGPRQCLELAAFSDVEQFDNQSATVIAWKQAIAAASLESPGWKTWNDLDSLHATSAWRQLGQKIGVSQLAAWTLSIQEQVVATVVLAGNWTAEQAELNRQWDTQWGGTLSAQIQQWYASHRTLTETFQERARKFFKRQSTRRWLAASLMVMLLLLVPVPYQLDCNAVLQPTFRKFIASPFEGILSESLVLAGDEVVAGQVLARLDGAPLRLELAGLEAEHAAVRKRSNAALAQGNVSDSQIAESEAKRIQAKIDLLRSRLADLEIRSPLAGMIVSGDLAKSTGAPLQKGQVLFEVAPLATMQLEVQIPEADIRLVKSQQDVALRLSAFPFDHWQTQIQRVQPRAELVEQANVFIGEAEIENFQQSLRPGMKGRAAVDVGWKPIGWIWFRRVWERLRCQWIW